MQLVWILGSELLPHMQRTCR